VGNLVRTWREKAGAQRQVGKSQWEKASGKKPVGNK
jgi:hypothetical protein